MKTLQELESKLAEPSEALVSMMKELDGDLLLLGIGGKMGPSMANLAINAIKQAGVSKRVIGASRFSSGTLREELEALGVETIAIDLLNDEELQKLPDVKNVIYMAGNKFGTTGKEHFTWAMNSYLPGRVAEKYRESRIVAFSTGNIYPFVPVLSGGADESVSPDPIGEYGQSSLGRERVFQHFSHLHQFPLSVIRLNYAIDLRYGVLLELAKSIQAGKPIPLAMGHFNCIWQGDANEMALRSLQIGKVGGELLNVTGPETVSVRWAASLLGDRLGIKPVFEGEESSNALLNNASYSHQIFGYPRVSLRQMIDWIAEWVTADAPTWNKETHFQERGGKF
ncbi:NAD-dependent epimerase/dehydratase family protein [Cohnella faecalis]|uniref:NAD(P)-dependent oxidoreductase n=1 Tax=Cohnella faecalis TaxID=2315694 RepID=A0A398CHU9_9BACL|nr:NAD(P)-dependent oxidoreductase [Cohnella faecalis]RIE00458.1 NAD(P)-dependent oxidoreductase [Cohnella faecalis]